MLWFMFTVSRPDRRVNRHQRRVGSGCAGLLHPTSPMRLQDQDCLSHLSSPSFRRSGSAERGARVCWLPAIGNAAGSGRSDGFVGGTGYKCQSSPWRDHSTHLSGDRAQSQHRPVVTLVSSGCAPRCALSTTAGKIVKELYEAGNITLNVEHMQIASDT